MNYLVTGGAGFVGSKITDKLISQGHQVVIIDNLSTGYLENVNPNAIFIKGDCSDVKIISKLERFEFDAILHIAGQSSGEISFEDPIYDINSNTVSTLLLLQYAVKTKCRRVIYASTMSVYGQQAGKDCFSEEDQTNPMSFYAVGKLASENYLKIYARNYGINFTALRYFNIYGPGQNLENLQQGMISIYLKQLIDPSFENIIVKGALERFRDFIYIDDIVSITTSFIFQESTFNEIINIGTGKMTSVNDLLFLLKTHTGISKEIDFQPGTPGDQFGIYANINKLGQYYNSTLITVENGIKLFCESVLRKQTL